MTKDELIVGRCYRLTRETLVSVENRTETLYRSDRLIYRWTSGNVDLPSFRVARLGGASVCLHPENVELYRVTSPVEGRRYRVKHEIDLPFLDSQLHGIQQVKALKASDIALKAILEGCNVELEPDSYDGYADVSGGMSVVPHAPLSMPDSGIPTIDLSDVFSSPKPKRERKPKLKIEPVQQPKPLRRVRRIRTDVDLD